RSAGRPVVRRGPRLDQRRLPRPFPGHRSHPRTDRRADPHRPHLLRAEDMNLTLGYAARSDRGLVRDGNQDSVYGGPRLRPVADVMGGTAAGDIPRTIVIAGLAPLDEDVPGDAPIDALRASVAAANEQLRRKVADTPE